MTETLKPIEEMSFEEAMSELETVVRKLESGSIRLEDAVKIYERGTLLQKYCAEKLKSAKSKIDLLIIEKNKPVGVESFDDKLDG